ncbi:hypothetical protein [Hydrogenophaga crocea]|uniref:Uncharacterized protein n=1 Tax=Hydrogenophaga crocea TaxID=2716225 RepID=A0A6G8II49_9BURK|nr:hypothetical protein [Hydrogenophaga crocea]QIM52738.1 hypothetical protein G9Q37_11565 [Hydrogenophaga crocea]
MPDPPFAAQGCTLTRSFTNRERIFLHSVPKASAVKRATPAPLRYVSADRVSLFDILIAVFVGTMMISALIKSRIELDI